MIAPRPAPAAALARWRRRIDLARPSQSLGRHATRAAIVATLGSAVLYGLAFPPTLAAAARLGGAGAAAGGAATRVAAGGARARGAVDAGGTCMVADWLPASSAEYYEQPLAVGIGFFLGIPLVMAVPSYVAFVVLPGPGSRAGGAAAARRGGGVGGGRIRTHDAAHRQSLGALSAIRRSTPCRSSRSPPPASTA